LKAEGYYIEESNNDFDCIDFINYSVLIIIDSEKHLTKSEINKLKLHYEAFHLSLLIVTEWHQSMFIESAAFNDIETFELNKPIIG
jgi:hypothetical protein